jgi:hypothetical protein
MGMSDWVGTPLHEMFTVCSGLLTNNSDIEKIDISMDEEDQVGYRRTLRMVVKLNVSQEGSDEVTSEFNQQHRPEDPRP